MTEMYFLILLEAGSPRSKCQQVSPEACVLGLQTAGFLLCPHMNALPTPSPTSSCVCLCVQISFSYIDTSQIGLGPTPMASF